VLRTTKFTIANVVVAIAAGGCVDGFQGANLQLDLVKTATTADFPVQAHVVGTPGPGEVAAGSHFSLYAIPDLTVPASAFEIARFELHRIVDPTSPCFIDVGEHVPHPGLHVTQFAQKIAEDTGIADVANPPPGATEMQKIEAATALQRAENVGKIAGDIADAAGDKTGIRAVTSASTGGYPPVATACNGPADQIPPATCIDDASNARRLELCQKAWAADPNLFEGTDRVLTTPLNGRTYGLVDGVNPVNEAPIGGAQFFLDNPLDNIQGFAIFNQLDGADASGPGTRVVGTVPSPTPVNTMPTRGVSHFTLLGAGPVTPGPPLVAFVAVFSDLGDDSVHF